FGKRVRAEELFDCGVETARLRSQLKKRSPVPIVFAGQRKADRQTLALAYHSERDGRSLVAVNESPEVWAREGRAVDGLYNVACAQPARGAWAVGSDGYDEQAAARPEARSAARVQPDCVEAEGLQGAGRVVHARGLSLIARDAIACRGDARLSCLHLLLSLTHAKLRFAHARVNLRERRRVRGALPRSEEHTSE